MFSILSTLRSILVRTSTFFILLALLVNFPVSGQAQVAGVDEWEGPEGGVGANQLLIEDTNGETTVIEIFAGGPSIATPAPTQTPAPGTIECGTQEGGACGGWCPELQNPKLPQACVVKDGNCKCVPIEASNKCKAIQNNPVACDPNGLCPPSIRDGSYVANECKVASSGQACACKKIAADQGCTTEVEDGQFVCKNGNCVVDGAGGVCILDSEQEKCVCKRIVPPTQTPTPPVATPNPGNTPPPVQRTPNPGVKPNPPVEPIDCNNNPLRTATAGPVNGGLNESCGPGSLGTETDICPKTVCENKLINTCASKGGICPGTLTTNCVRKNNGLLSVGFKCTANCQAKCKNG